MCIGLHLKRPYSFQNLMKLKLPRHSFKKCPCINVHKNLSSGSQVVLCGQTGRAELIVAFGNFRVRLKVLYSRADHRWQNGPCAFACWITKNTETYTEYVILITFPQQKWLYERTLILRYTVRTLPVWILLSFLFAEYAEKFVLLLI